MKIEINQGTQPVFDSSPCTSAASNDTQQADNGALGEDQTQLPRGHSIQALAAQVLQFPEIRQEKVKAVRQMVREGSYNPSPNDVADALFDHMLPLAGE